MTSYLFGSANPNWKGGRHVTKKGYVLLRMPGHPLADCRGYVYEHRLVASRKLGRLLTPDEEAHHRNEVKGDNRPTNVEVKTPAEHTSAHKRKPDSVRRRPGEENPEVECACGCGARFGRYGADGVPRRFVQGHNGKLSPVGLTKRGR